MHWIRLVGQDDNLSLNNVRLFLSVEIQKPAEPSDQRAKMMLAYGVSSNTMPLPGVPPSEAGP
jgi:hypothetical protein